MVLSAGYGSRLRPLTAMLPKPLLPVGGRPLAAWTLERVAKAGAELAVLNLHHRGQDIERALGRKLGGLPLRYNSEAELLGTWGALAPVRETLAESERILLVNADTLCRWPLKKLLRQHEKSGAAATLLLASRAAAQAFGGGVGVDSEGYVVDFGAARARQPGTATVSLRPPAGVAHRYVFGGAHVLSPQLLEQLPEPGVAADIISDLYQPMLRSGAKIATLVTTRPWHDVGTPVRYLSAVVDELYRRRFGLRRRWIAPGAQVNRSAKVVLSAIEAGAEIGAKVLVDRSLVLAGARVGAGSQIRSCIIGPGVALPARSTVQGRLVTPLRAGRHPGGGDSVVGTLVFSPLVDLAGS